MFNVMQCRIRKPYNSAIKVSGCCLTPNDQIWPLYHSDNMLYQIRWYSCPSCTRPTLFNWMFVLLADLNNSQWVDMSTLSVTFFWFRFNECLFLLLNAVYLAVKQQIPISVFRLNWTGLEPVNNRTRGDHAKHYTSKKTQTWLYCLLLEA